MADLATEPRDLEQNAEQESALEQNAGQESADRGPAEHTPGRWEREAQALHREGPEDPATRSSRIYFFIMLTIIVAAIAVFLVLHPQGGG